MKYKYSDQDLIKAIKDSNTLSQVCRILQIKPKGGNYKTLNNKIKKLNLDISHFLGKSWNKEKKYTLYFKSKPLHEILIENSFYSNTNILRKRLIHENIKQHKCESCELEIWKNQKIPLELNHINGINNDNRIENLELLCPNCHALTPNYRGKNIKKKQLKNYKPDGRKTRFIRINERKTERPNFNDLLTMVKKNGYKNTGKMFNVSDNCIRKWIKQYEKQINASMT